MLIYGGLGWGLSMALFFSILRWIEYKPPAFGSHYLLFLICIICGIAWGIFKIKLDHKKQELNISFASFLKSMLVLFLSLCIYGLCFRYILIPAQLQSTMISTLILVALICIALIIDKKLVSNRHLS